MTEVQFAQRPVGNDELEDEWVEENYEDNREDYENTGVIIIPRNTRSISMTTPLAGCCT